MYGKAAADVAGDAAQRRIFQREGFDVGLQALGCNSLDEGRHRWRGRLQGLGRALWRI